MNTATTTLPATKPPRLPMAGLEPDSPEAQLFAALRPLRRQLAADHDVRPYIILSDASLADLVRLRPANREVLLCVKGIGPVKADNFGTALLAWIREESARLGLALTEVPIATGRRSRAAMPPSDGERPRDAGLRAAMATAPT